MVNLHSPILSPEAGLALVSFWHVMAGIYFWEFFTTLDYEWRVFRDRLSHRRYTIWIYSLTRVACLFGVIVCTFGFDTNTYINCQIWIISVATFFCLSSAAASLLIVLRIIAIWNRHKVVTATSIIVWGTGVTFHISAAVRLRSTWNPVALKCFATTEKGVLGLIPAIFADLVLLVIMLVGLLLLRRHGGGMFGLTPILWRQGVIWLSLAIVSGTPPAVIAVLSTNGQFNNMLLTPGLIMMTITATRTHRSLVDYASGCTDVVSAQENIKLPKSSAIFSKIKRAPAALNSQDLTQIEVTVHTAFEQDTVTQTNDHDSYNSTNGQVHEKPNARGLDDDVERGM